MHNTHNPALHIAGLLVLAVTSSPIAAHDQSTCSPIVVECVCPPPPGYKAHSRFDSRGNPVCTVELEVTPDEWLELETLKK